MVRLISSALLAFLGCLSVPAQSQPSLATAALSAVAQSDAPHATETQQSKGRVTAYTLPPDLYKKAHDLGTIYFRLAILGFFYGLAALWIVLRFRISAKYRDWALRASSVRFLQAIVFSIPLILTIAILELPLRIYGHHISYAYGLSVQGWRSWIWDWTKSQLISVVIGMLLVWILYAVIRKSPRRWWFNFWLVSLPLGLAAAFLTPLVIDPMFHKFEPLQQKDPALTTSLEQMVQRAGEDIPPQRMFWMRASEKTTALNAYVTGFGASKRIVVWDTTIAKMNTPQVVSVAGHEMGHYVLNHFTKGLIFGAVVAFVLFYLGFRSIGWLLRRWGADWGVRGVDDWASLPALLLLLSVFSFAANPVTNAFSRRIEHQADQYALEVTHGLIPDSGQVAAQAEQILGEVDLSDPDPNPVNVFLFYTHPPTADRIRFELSYDPWANGGHGEFVP
jgi:STE24 endopeptidase